MTETATLITQLRVLAHLTRTEAQVARLRIAQARTDDVRRELAQNAQHADTRAGRIVGALRDLGALPDPVTPALGRLTALLRGAVEQTQPLDEALLGDLALEHQLRDRARYLAALARAAGLPAVAELADDLEAAHTATVEWLTAVLADVAADGPAALEASPLQRVAGRVTRAVNAPGRAAVAGAGRAVTDGLDRAVGTVVDTASRAGGEARATVEEYAGRAAQVGADAAKEAVAVGQGAVAAGQEAVTAGRDVAVQAVGSVARRVSGSAESDDATAVPTTDTDVPDTDVPDTEVPATGGLPIPGFAAMGAQAAVAAVRTLDDPAAVAAVLAFEQAHGDRPGVVAAARARARAVEPARGL